MVASMLLVGVLLAACWTDLRSRRIPNWLTVGGMLAGLAVRVAMGPGPLGNGVLGIGLAAVLALPCFAMGALGGGDVKLLMAVGAFMGPADLAWASLAIAVVGGVVALLEAMRRGVLLPTLASCGALILSWVTLGRRGKERMPGADGRLAVPYGVAIAVGSLLWWFAGGLAS